MHGLSSKGFISSRQALVSHRSAVDIVKMHQLQFQSQQLMKPEKGRSGQGQATEEDAGTVTADHLDDQNR